MGNNSAVPAEERTTNRDRIIYDEREDKTYPADTHKAITESFPPVDPNTKSDDVSRETSDEEIRNEEPIEEKTKGFDVSDQSLSENIIYDVDIELVIPNPEQPRTNFKEEDLKELAASIKREGIIQPILVRETDDGKYQIIAGERRWQASKLAGLDTVPVQVKDVDDEKALELALIENIQRSDLNPIEEAYGYKRLMERNQMSQADIAQAVSKGRSTIANSLRLLDLPEDAQKLLFDEEITAGHARAILSVPDKEGRAKLTRKLAENKLSVRETEQIARLMSNKPTGKKDRMPIPPVYKSVARALKQMLDTDVKVKSSGGKNKIEISFTNEQDLERIFKLIDTDE